MVRILDISKKDTIFYMPSPSCRRINILSHVYKSVCKASFDDLISMSNPGNTSNLIYFCMHTYIDLFDNAGQANAAQKS